MAWNSKKKEAVKFLLQEANGMHAGEMYGEKATLATEVRELQSRLLILSDERMVYVTRSTQVQLPIDIIKRRMEPLALG